MSDAPPPVFLGVQTDTSMPLVERIARMLAGERGHNPDLLIASGTPLRVMPWTGGDAGMLYDASTIIPLWKLYENTAEAVLGALCRLSLDEWKALLKSWGHSL